jgi:hypothetical protein
VLVVSVDVKLEHRTIREGVAEPLVSHKVAPRASLTASLLLPMA